MTNFTEFPIPYKQVTGTPTTGTFLRGDGQWQAPDSYLKAEADGRFTPRTAALLPGVAGNLIVAPDAPQLNVAGDIDIRVLVAMDNWTPSSAQTLVGKGYGNQYWFYLGENIGFAATTAGGTSFNVTPWEDRPANGTPLWVRVTRVASTGLIVFWIAPASMDEPTDWTAIAVIGSPAGDLVSSDQPLGVGAAAQIGADYVQAAGKFYRVQVLDGIDGTVVADWRVEGHHTGRATSTDSVGNVWTIRGSAWLWDTDGARTAGPITQYARGLVGTGFPEGVVTAPVGTQYQDLAATNGAVLWVKATGTGNTGWVVAYGDTGWRNIAGVLENSWTAAAPGLARIRRMNNQVIFLANTIDPAAASSDTFYTPPTGFRGDDVAWFAPVGFFDEAATEWVRLYFDNTLRTPRTVGGVRLGSYIWTTTNAWPATLPGVAA
jgi:hypothetical protein